MTSTVLVHHHTSPSVNKKNVIYVVWDNLDLSNRVFFPTPVTQAGWREKWNTITGIFPPLYPRAPVFGLSFISGLYLGSLKTSVAISNPLPTQISGNNPPYCPHLSCLALWTAEGNSRWDLQFLTYSSCLSNNCLPILATWSFPNGGQHTTTYYLLGLLCYLRSAYSVQGQGFTSTSFTEFIL